MWEKTNFQRVEEGGGTCENPVGLSMYESHMEIGEYICVDIGACLIGRCHKTAEMNSLCMQQINW